MARMTKVLYQDQHEGNLPKLNAADFVELIENRDPKIQGFFDILYNAMNPKGKNMKTQECLKQKIMLLCYQMAALRNKQVGGAKTAIGLYMAGTGTSTVGINTLSNMGISATYQTVYNNKKKIVDTHSKSIQEYVSDNVRNFEIYFVNFEYL